MYSCSFLLSDLVLSFLENIAERMVDVPFSSCSHVDLPYEMWVAFFDCN